MRISVVLCLMVTFVMFGFGQSLQCYSCPNGSRQKCEVKQECTNEENSCLKLKRDGMTYTSCVRFADCEFNILSERYLFPKFKFSCCQSNLCNGPSIFERISGMFD